MDTGQQALRQGQYDRAEVFFQAALKAVDGDAGDVPRESTTLLNLATLYQAWDKYAAAEPLYQRALSLREQRLGKGHQEVAEVLEGYVDLLRLLHPWRARLPWSAAARMNTRAQRIREAVDKGSGLKRSQEEWPKDESEVFDSGNS